MLLNRKPCLIKPGSAVQVRATDGVAYVGTLMRPARGTHAKAMIVMLDDTGEGMYRGTTLQWLSEYIKPAFSGRNA